MKFGVTRNLSVRHGALQAGSPYLLEVVAKVTGSRKLEPMIHRYLHRERLHGEWFSRSDRTLEVIDLMRSGDAVILGRAIRVRKRRPVKVTDYTKQLLTNMKVVQSPNLANCRSKEPAIA